MILSDDIKAKIQVEYDSWKDKLWAGKTKEERSKLGQFATPPPLTIKMLEKFDSIEDKDILDPCLGAGNLIAAAIIAGADPKKCYGIELDPEVLQVAKHRLACLGVPPCNLVQGDALDPKSYEEKLQPFNAEAFAVVTKTDDSIELTVVKDKLHMKKITYTDKLKLKDMLNRLVKKKVPIFKI